MYWNCIVPKTFKTGVSFKSKGALNFLLLGNQCSLYLLRPRGLQIPAFLTNGKMRCLVKSSHHFSQFAGFNQFHAAGSCCSFAWSLGSLFEEVGNGEKDTPAKWAKCLLTAALKNSNQSWKSLAIFAETFYLWAFAQERERRRKAK